MLALIADSDINIQQTLKAYVERLSPQCEAICFRDPMQLLKFWRVNKEDCALVITPAVSNVGDGFKILNIVNNSQNVVPVFLTAQSINQELKLLAQLRGASGFLSKPLDYDAFKDEMNSWYIECADSMDTVCDMKCICTNCRWNKQQVSNKVLEGSL